MSLIILAGSAFSAGISSFAAQPEIEIMDIDNSNPFDYEHYITKRQKMHAISCRQPSKTP